MGALASQAMMTWASWNSSIIPKAVARMHKSLVTPSKMKTGLFTFSKSFLNFLFSRKLWENLVYAISSGEGVIIDKVSFGHRDNSDTRYLSGAVCVVLLRGHIAKMLVAPALSIA